MSEPARNRFALDLDDLERQLRGAAQPQKPGTASDPLIELTRLVGQDDPLKELFAGRSADPARPAAMAAPQPASWARAEPSFQPTLVAQPSAQSAPPPADVRGALDEFEALLRRTEPVRTAPQPAAQAPAARVHNYDEPEPLPVLAQPYAMQQEGAHAYVPEQPRDLDEAAGQVHAQAHAYAHPPVEDYHQAAADYDAQPHDDEHEHRDFRRARSRKGMLTAAALVVVAVGGVSAAMLFRNGRPAGVNGQPPVIAADNGPSKVAPVNPGGAEIPNQNKQIYERSGDAATDKTKVVSREEQPVDVQQAARSMAPRPTQASNGAITPTDTASAGLAPTEPGLVPIPAVPGLGEPRKVRTVAIRPDGTPAPANAAAANGVGQGIVTGSAPSARPASATPAPAAQAQGAARPQQPGATPATAPKTQERAAVPATPPAAQTPPANTRTAALAPQQQPQATAPAAAAPRTDPNGGFAVQLGAPGSEAEARATFAALQRKYPDQLTGQSPIIRKTELAGGKTVYRLRVGPYAREDASSMCTALQAAGGQCFIAKN